MPAVQTRGEAMVAPLRALGLDGMTLHWELAYGLERVREVAAQLPYPLLAANYHQRGAAAPFQPFTVVERGGLKVIGLAAVVATHLLPPDGQQPARRGCQRGRRARAILRAEKTVTPALRRNVAVV